MLHSLNTPATTAPPLQFMEAFVSLLSPLIHRCLMSTVVRLTTRSDKPTPQNSLATLLCVWR